MKINHTGFLLHSPNLENQKKGNSSNPFFRRNLTTDTFVYSKKTARPSFYGISIWGNREKNVYLNDKEVEPFLKNLNKKNSEDLLSLISSESGYSKDLLEKFLDLKSYTNSFPVSKRIFKECLYTDKQGNKKLNKELYESLFKDVPDDLNKANKSKYILSRLSVSKESQGKEQSKLNKTAFKFFNKMYEKSKNIEDVSAIENITRICVSNDTKDAFSFNLNAADYMSFSDLSDLNNLLGDEDTDSDIYNISLEVFKDLKPNDKEDFLSVSRELSDFADCDFGSLVSGLKALKNKYPLYKDDYIACYIAMIISYCSNNQIFDDNKFNYLINAKDVEDINFFSEIYDNNLTVNENIERLELSKRLLDIGFEVDDLAFDFKNSINIFDKKLSKKDKENLLKEAEEFANMGINTAYISSLLILTPEQREQVFDLRNEAIKRKDVILNAGVEDDEDYIDDVFFPSAEKVANAINVVGKDALLYSFSEKIDNVENYICTIGSIKKENNPYYEKLLQMTNPTKSQKFEKMTDEIIRLKSMLKNEQNQDKRQELMNLINTTTKDRNNFVHGAIKDPKLKLEAASIFAAIWGKAEKLNSKNKKTNASISNILPYMNPQTEKQKKDYYNRLNDILFKLYDLNNLDKNVMKSIDLKNSKYLSKMFLSNEAFQKHFVDMVKILNKKPNMKPINVFNSMSQNVETNRAFVELGLNYDNWVNVNPSSKISVSTRTDKEKQRKSAVRNLEADFNDEMFNKIPKIEVKKIFDALKNIGVDVIEKEEVVYADYGIYSGKNKVLKFYKDNRPIEFNDLSQIMKVIKQVINKNAFWNNECEDLSVKEARDTIKNHLLKLRNNEIKLASIKGEDQDINLTVQKIDMNDIPHSLFLGNDASCCTAIGSGCNQCSAPTYIINKMVSGIEIKDGDDSVGNTMIYVAEVDGKPSLLLDNIELKSKYQYNDKIRDAIFDCAKLIAKELGKSDMSIYAGPNRHKVNMDEYELTEKKFNLVGSTGDYQIYLDFETENSLVNKDTQFISNLYKII